MSSQSEPSRFETIQSLRDLLQNILGAIDDVQDDRLTHEVDTGIYENAVICGSDGVEYPLERAYYWSTRSDGRHLVDILERDVPPEVDLAECSLTIYSRDGVPLLGGSSLDDGNLNEGLGSITLLLEDDHALDHYA